MARRRAPAAARRDLQERMIALIRAFGLHKPDQTPCGRPVSVAEVGEEHGEPPGGDAGGDRGWSAPVARRTGGRWS